MAKVDIKIDIPDLQSTLNLLRASMDDFESYTTTFRSNTRDRLTGFNSDFISKVDGLLKNMNDDANTDLLEQLKGIHQAGEKLLKEMKEVDEQLGQAMGGGTS